MSTQRRNFSVTKTVAEATGFVLNNIRLLARIGAAPFAVETAGLLRALWAERAHESYLSEMWAILYLIAIVPYQTQIQRYVLGLVPISERPALFPWDMRETRFFLHAVGLFLVAAVLSFCSLIPFAIYGWLYSGSLSFHITGLAAVPGVLALAASLVYAGYIFARLQIVLHILRIAADLLPPGRMKFLRDSSSASNLSICFSAFSKNSFGTRGIS